MREQFDQELAYLQKQFADMFGMVTKALENTVRAFQEKDLVLAEQVMKKDHRINQKEIDIEMDCARLIALQQPVVADLRLIISIMQVCSDLERMGDHTASVAKSVHRIVDHKQMPDVEERIVGLGEQVLDVLRETLAIYQAMDADVAHGISEKVESVEQERKAIVELCRLHMKEDAKYVFDGAEYISVLMHLKRVADYATNICERVIYIQTGEIVELS